MCGATFYDPCMCADGNCNGHEFSPLPECALKFDARIFTSEQTRLASMHWPDAIERREAGEQDEVELADALRLVAAHPSGADSQELLEKVRAVLLEVDEEVEGDAPHSFCDDLLDYWDPAAQHPVGYHPTTACKASETNMRGFDTWMTADNDGTPVVDPVRRRNATAFSSELGHAHVLCDGAAYGLPAQSLNPYFLESQWRSDAAGDAAVPVKPTQPQGPYQHGENPREDPFDSPLVAAADADSFRHSLGLVRDWPRLPGNQLRKLLHMDTQTKWTNLEGGNTPLWPNWGPAIEAFGSDAETALEHCPVHRLLVLLACARRACTAPHCVAHICRLTTVGRCAIPTQIVWRWKTRRPRGCPVCVSATSWRMVCACRSGSCLSIAKCTRASCTGTAKPNTAPSSSRTACARGGGCVRSRGCPCTTACRHRLVRRFRCSLMVAPSIPHSAFRSSRALRTLRQATACAARGVASATKKMWKTLSS